MLLVRKLRLRIMSGPSQNLISNSGYRLRGRSTEDATGGAAHNLGASLELAGGLADVGAADADVALDIHEAAERVDDLLDLGGQLAGGRQDEGLRLLGGGVDALESADRERGRLTRARLGLSDHIATLDHLADRTLLNGRGLLETETVDAAKERLLKSHLIERGHHLHALARFEVLILQSVLEFAIIWKGGKLTC